METNTEKKILEAATKMFMLKGLEGARMQEIADEAEVTKAMLHYYFRNKQQLFDIIFEEKVKHLFSIISQNMQSDLPLEEKILNFISFEIDFIWSSQQLPLFIILECRKNPEILKTKFKKAPFKQILGNLNQFLKDEIEKGTIRNINTEQLLMSIISLCIYPIIAKPIFEFALDTDDAAYKKLMDERKQVLTDMIINYIKK